MEIQVTVTDIFPVETRSYTTKDGKPGTFSSRKVWGVDNSNPNYPEHLEFTFTGKAIDYPTAVEPGDIVLVDCALSGRQYTKDGKTSLFMSIRAWGIKKIGQTLPPPADPNEGSNMYGTVQPPAQDLPF